MILQEVKTQYGVLHNRKTGGTALKDILDQQKQRTPDFPVLMFGHPTTFPLFIEHYPTAKAIFFIRDPLSRFVSGFYSRLRQGLPRYHFPWSRAEAKAFKRFETPNHLGEALSESGFFERRAAIAAMKSIRHVRHTYVEFFGKLDFLKKHAPNIAFIGHQANFDADLAQLRLLLKVDADIETPSDDVKAHRNPEGLDKHLSKRAIANLENWYHADFEIYEWCLHKRRELLQALEQPVEYSTPISVSMA